MSEESEKDMGRKLKAAAEDWDKDLFKQARQSGGMTQVEFANFLNLGISTVEKWEMGKREPGRQSRQKLDRFGRALAQGVSVEKIQSGKPIIL